MWDLYSVNGSVVCSVLGLRWLLLQGGRSLLECLVNHLVFSRFLGVYSYRMDGVCWVQSFSVSEVTFPGGVIFGLLAAAAVQSRDSI